MMIHCSVLSCPSMQLGDLQSGLGVVQVGLRPYVRAVKNAYTSVMVGAVTVYTAGHDTYKFLRDPPPGFFPRVSVISLWASWSDPGKERAANSPRRATSDEVGGTSVYGHCWDGRVLPRSDSGCCKDDWAEDGCSQPVHHLICGINL
uniref:Uncharacterized protein n=1 Tax=Hucho hucho TaxID=62062 RepID=A0A4W5LNG3_9TELE